MMGRDSLLLSTYLDWSTVLSDIDMPTWRNRASLRVRYFSLGACQEPTETMTPEVRHLSTSHTVFQLDDR
jgi:hypothetical protein